MNASRFYQILFLITAIVVVVLLALHQLVPDVRPHAPLSVMSILLFLGICLGLFYAGTAAVRSSNKMAFNSLVSVSVFGKMVLALGVLFAYRAIYAPDNQWFVGIFLLIYLVYTGFEVWFLTKVAKSK